MYLRTISTQPVNYIENNFTLAQLDAAFVESDVLKFADQIRETATVLINSYDVVAKLSNSYDVITKVRQVI